MLNFILAIALIGAPPAANAKQGAPAHTDTPLPRLFSTDDYPADAIRRNEQGDVAVTLTIDPEGRVVRCDVQQHATAALDQRTCSVLVERARYKPARDAQGRPMAGSDGVRIRWVLPKQELALPDLIERTLTLSSDGRATGCEGHLMFNGAEVKEASPSLCQGFDKVPAALAGDLAAMSNQALPRVRISWRWIRDSKASLPLLGQSTDERLLSSRVVAVQYDASGKQTGCAVENATGSLGMALLGSCDQQPKEIDPTTLAGDRRVRLASALYLIGE